MKKQEDKNLFAMRHSTAHLLAYAVQKLYPTTKFAIGPVIENGFYYDFEFEESLKGEEIKKIEKEMKKLKNKDVSFEQSWISIEEAKKLFKNQPYKLEIIEEIKKGEREDFGQKDKVSIYKCGEFVDLCKGPHVKSFREIGEFKLIKTAGAYWKGDEKNKMLTRIYGVAFKTKDELKEYLNFLEEAKLRDHRKLGKELDLFIINPSIGKGLPLLTPKGAVIRNEILKYEEKIEREAGFMPVWTPHIASVEIYKQTGHFQHYSDVMYAPFGIDGEDYVLKPMNCPHHYMIYKSRPRSYKDLPFRLTEPGTCYRYEKTGELSGLLRVRALTIDDSHILMTENQIEDEFKLCIGLIRKMFKAFQLNDYYVRLSLADPSDAVKYIADDATWKKAGEILEKIIKDNGLDYVKAKGEASFYGPKIDFIVQDALKRDWQMSTLQLDLFMAKRLNLTYVDKDGKTKHPVILHRGLTGSIERTMAILIEHFKGAFPVWLAPVQIKIIPIGEDQLEYANKVYQQLFSQGFRIEVDKESETMQKKIRKAQKEKVPYMIILGKQEEKDKTVSIRTRDGKQENGISLEKFAERVRKQVEEKN